MTTLGGVVKVCVTPEDVVFSRVNFRKKSHCIHSTHIEVDGVKYYLDHTTPCGHDVYQAYNFDDHVTNVNGRLVGGGCLVTNTTTLKLPKLWESWVGCGIPLPARTTFAHNSGISMSATGVVSKCGGKTPAKRRKKPRKVVVADSEEDYDDDQLVDDSEECEPEDDEDDEDEVDDDYVEDDEVDEEEEGDDDEDEDDDEEDEDEEA